MHRLTTAALALLRPSLPARGTIPVAALVAALVTALVSPAAAEPAAEARVLALLGGLETLQADFVQEVSDENGRMIERSDGRFAMAAPDRFRWHYLSPYEQLIVADGERVWLHDVDLEQVTVKDQQEAAGSSPLYVLSQPESLAERFLVEQLPADPGEDVITLEPVSAGADFERVLLRFVDGRLAELIIDDAFGQRTAIRFDALERNVAIVPGRFEFAAPPGVDVIGLEALLGNP